MQIEDYGLVGDLETSALVGRDGSVEWLCLPRFDSGACFSALLGDESHGHWRIGPADGGPATRRRYRENTLILEHEWDVPGGTVRLVDAMPPRDEAANLVRVVEGVSGNVPMRMDLAIRLDYGASVPWVTTGPDGISAVAGPDALRLRTPVPLRGEGLSTVAEFTVEAGERIPFTLDWHASHRGAPEPIDAFSALEQTDAFWREWSEISTYEGEWAEAVGVSLRVLKALTYAPTGGIVAAPTTSLPEALGGVRNWDYRYCWIRDATLTLYALAQCGYAEEALAFRDWLLRASAGTASQLQIMYGVAGERRLPEQELQWLPGYEGAGPVRAGNAAVEQFQLDVYGEMLDLAWFGAQSPRHIQPIAWKRQLSLMNFLETAAFEPDEGIWEVRGPRRHFTHSKVMAWVAFDRAVRIAEHGGLEGPVGRWSEIRDRLHAEICAKGFDEERGTFTQYYGSHELDASALIIPTMGFLPPDDPRVRGTVDAIRRELVEDGFVYRYSTGEHEGAVDGLPGKEGAFLPCSFWLCDALEMTGRHDEAVELFERLLAVGNDLGLYAEEYDPAAGRMVGNFPQAFTHLAIVTTAHHLSGLASPRAPRQPHAGASP
jgi:GH15 family glucan-1,4-alpha-glucosidase